MNSKQFHRRVWVMVLLLALIVTGMGATLYDLQINNGDSYYELTQRKIPERQTVQSIRGQILDRNGQVLVSNRVIYEVTLNTRLMKDASGKDVRNDVILALIRAARAEGVEWTDGLPISKTAPFTFDGGQPYYTTSRDEEGGVTKTLTRLGRLAVKMKWLKDDPTKEPEEEEAKPEMPREPSLTEKIKAFFGVSQPEPEAPEAPKGPEPLPGAEKLLGRMCASFGIAGEGAVDKKEAEKNGGTVPDLNIGNLSKRDARAMAGVLYEVYLRTQEVYIATEYVFASDVDIDFISRVKELDLPGVVIEARTMRQYHTRYAAHLLGQVGQMTAEEWAYYKTVDEDGDGVVDYQMNDVVGKMGAELAFESLLRGKSGTRTVERNTRGKIVGEEWIAEPEPGDNVILTLDIGLQAYVENLLAESVPQLQSKETEGAACVVLDVKTAEVLAAANYPTFDLINYASELREKNDDPLHPFLNRALNGLYPPGSTFKMITAIGALEEGVITPKSKIRDEGRYTYWTEVNPPQCWIYRGSRGNHGLIDVTEAIRVSCNYFFFEAGRLLGIEKLDEYAARFGLGEKSGIELGEQTGAVAGPAYTESRGGRWYEGSITSVAIGQESTQATPLQLANYVATLVNGGTRHAAHMLKETKSGDFTQVTHRYEPQVLDEIDIQPQNLAAVKAGMLQMAQTSRAFQELPFKAGAKTGSAQVSVQTESNAVFVCFAPYDDPEIAVAMAVEHGGSGIELANMAAEVLSYYFSSKETREEIPAENTLIR